MGGISSTWWAAGGTSTDPRAAQRRPWVLLTYPRSAGKLREGGECRQQRDGRYRLTGTAAPAARELIELLWQRTGGTAGRTAKAGERQRDRMQKVSFVNDWVRGNNKLNRIIPGLLATFFGGLHTVIWLWEGSS